MKNTCKKILISLFVSSVLAGLIGSSVNADTDAVYFGYINNPAYDYFNNGVSLLSDDEISYSVSNYDIVNPENDTYYTAENKSEMIEDMRSQVKAYKEVISIGYTSETELTGDEIAQFFFVDMMEHTGNPTDGDYLKYQIGGASYSYQKSGNNYIINYTPVYYMTQEQEEAVTERVGEIISEYDLAGDRDDFSKAAVIYDYICDNVSYDYDGLNAFIGNQGTDNEAKYYYIFTPYAALINNSAVCQGYAALYYRLALEAGIDARVITGIGGETAENGESHAWNIVRIDENYYNIDATWDAGTGNYTYFLKNDEDFANHFRADEFSTETFYAAYPMSETSYGIPEDGLSGELDNGVTWTLSADGTLTFTGDGGIDYMPVGEYDRYVEKIVIEDGITYTAYGIFNFLKSLTSVEIGADVEDMDIVPFFGCDNLISIVVNNNPVYHSENNCMLYKTYDDGTLELVQFLVKYGGSVTINSETDIIGWSAFEGAYGVTGITLPEGLKEIRGRALFGCDGLTTVNIPSTVENIEWAAFAYCRNITEFTVTEGSTVFAADEYGVLFRKDDNGNYCNLNQYPLKSSLESYEVPETVWALIEGSFAGAQNLVDVHISVGVGSIESYVFSDCEKLENIYFDGYVPERIEADMINGCPNEIKIHYYPFDCWVDAELYFDNDNYSLIEREVTDAESGTLGDNITWTLDSMGTLTVSGTGEIPDNAFENNRKIFEVIIEEGITSIGEAAFRDCRNVGAIELPSTLIRIGSEAFKACTWVTYVTIPASVTEIGNGPFTFCDRLTYIEVEEGNEYYHSDDGVLYETYSEAGKKIVQYPKGKEGITYYIEDDTCVIGFCAFESTNLVNVIIPDTVELIEGYAFNDCCGISKINLPANLKFIAFRAFAGTNLNSIVIPSGVECIEGEAFADNANLTKVYFACGIETYNENTEEPVFNNHNDNLTIYYYPHKSGWDNVADGIWLTPDGQELNAVALNQCGDNLTWTMDSTGALTISGDGEMWECDAEYFIELEKDELLSGDNKYYYQSISPVPDIKYLYFQTVGGTNDIFQLADIRVTGTRTGDNDYEELVLRELEYPEDREIMSGYAFDDLDKLADVTNSNIVGGYIYLDGTYGFNNETSDNLWDGDDNTKLCTDVYPVQSLAALDGQYTVDGIIITIGADTNEYPDRNPVKWALYGSGDGVNWEPLAYSDDSFFDGDIYTRYVKSPWYDIKNEITSVTFESGVTTVGRSMFDTCVNIGSVDFGDTVETIQFCAFIGCEGIRELNLPASLTSIEDASLEGLLSLENITVENGNEVFETDEYGVLYNKAENIIQLYPTADEMTKYSIKEGTLVIGYNAFEFAENLSEITVPASVQSVKPFAFTDMKSLSSIHFKCDYIEDLKNYGIFDTVSTDVVIYYEPDNESWLSQVSENKWYYTEEVYFTALPYSEEADEEFRLIEDTDCTISGGKIYGIGEASSVESVLAIFDNAEIKAFNGENEITGQTIVGTGTVIRLYNNDAVVDQVTVIVMGDLDGDGIVDDSDARMYKLYKLNPSNAIEFDEAFDFNKDSKLDAHDLRAYKLYVLNKN